MFILVTTKITQHIYRAARIECKQQNNNKTEKKRVATKKKGKLVPKWLQKVEHVM